MPGPPVWADHAAAWLVYIAGFGVLLYLCGLTLWWGAIWSVRGLQAVLRMIGVYDDFWWWYRHQPIGAARRHRKED